MLLGTTDIRLLRAGFQAKYAGAADYEQVLHFDYPNHSLVMPPDDEIIGFFLYLSDITDELGATVWSRTGLVVTSRRTGPTSTRSGTATCTARNNPPSERGAACWPTGRRPITGEPR